MSTVHIVAGEISTVLAEMRFNTKWNTRAKMKESTLFQNLEHLRRKVESLPTPDVFQLDSAHYLQPFLDIIKSEETNGPITATVLASVHKFIQYGFLGPKATNRGKAIRRVVLAVSRCRFEATDHDTDEVVLVRILRVLEASLICDAGALLTNSLVFEMVQTCFKMSIQSRLPFVLRKSAEMTLLEMVQILFSRFKLTDPLPTVYSSSPGGDSSESVPLPLPLPLPALAVDSSSLGGDSDTEVSAVAVSEDSTASPAPAPVITVTETAQVVDPSDSDTAPVEPPVPAEESSSDAVPSEDIVAATPPPQRLSTSSGDIEVVKKRKSRSPHRKKRKSTDKDRETDTTGGNKRSKSPRGSSRGSVLSEDDRKVVSGSILGKVIRFFCTLVDSKRAQSVRILGLTLLNTILESQGTVILEQPALVALFKNEVSLVLIQSIKRNSDLTPEILPLVLRMFSNLFITLGVELRLQAEVYFALTRRLLEGDAPVVLCEMILENWARLLKNASFVADLYVNYDCDLQAPNVLEETVVYLHKTAQLLPSTRKKNNNSSSPAPAASLSILALEGLGACLLSIYQRMTQGGGSSGNSGTKSRTVGAGSEEQGAASITTVVERKTLKNLLALAAEKFNEKPIIGLEFALEKNLISDIDDAKCIAKYVRENVFISPVALGEYIGKKKDFNQEVLLEYIRTFTFAGVKFIHCCRMFFESFRPLGEAQVIDRYIEHFSTHYIDSNPSHIFASHDALFTLTYSVIMLNVDLHSPVLENRPKMTLEQYVKNVIDLNGDGKYPRPFLEDIYYEIDADEIKIHSEHLLKGKLTPESWNHLLSAEAKKSHGGTFITSPTAASLYDPLVFNVLWRKIHEATQTAYVHTEDTEILERCLSFFQMSALISSQFSLSHAFDHLMEVLCNLSRVAPVPTESYSVTFGHSSKSHYSMIALFTLARKHGHHIRDSWKSILSCMSTLEVAGLLPTLTHFKDVFTVVDEPLSVTEENSAAPGFGYSFFSPSSWFAQSPQSASSRKEDSPRNQADEVCERTVKQCKLPQLIQSTRSIHQESLISLVKALVESSTEHDLPTTSTTSSSSSSTTTATPSSSSKKERSSGAIFSLDLLTQVTLLNKHRISVIWPFVSEHFDNLTTASGLDFDFLFKTVTNMMILAQSLLSVPEIRTSFLQILQVITKFHIDDGNVQHHRLRRKIASGIRHFICFHLSSFSGKGDWTYVGNLIRWTSQSHHTVSDCFTILSQLILGEELEVEVDLVNDVNHTFACASNFGFLIDILTKMISSQSPSSSSPSSSSPSFSPSSSPSKGSMMMERGRGEGVSEAALVHNSLRALALLHQLVHVVPLFAAFEEGDEVEKEVLGMYWLPVLVQLSVISTHSPAAATPIHPQVRSTALSHLQRALLAPALFSLSERSWVTVFDKVVFPLLEEVISAEVGVSDDERLIGASILSKTFLQYLSKFVTSPTFHIFWLQVLALMQTFFDTNQAVTTVESVTQALKNIVMVMHASEVLLPDSSEKDISNSPYDPKRLWRLTWERIDQFCPKMREDLSEVIECPPPPTHTQEK